MLLQALYYLAAVGGFLVNAQADDRFLKPSIAEITKYDGQHNQNMFTNEINDEPKFASAYATLASEDVRTQPSVPVGKEDQLLLQDKLSSNIGLETDDKKLGWHIRMGFIKQQNDFTSSTIFQPLLQKLKDFSGELKYLAHHLDGVADQDDEKQYEPHLFMSIPLSLKGMKDVMDILDLGLFHPLQLLNNVSLSQGKREDNQQSGGRSKRTATVDAFDSTTPVENMSPEEEIRFTTVEEELPQDETLIEFMKSLKRSLDEATLKMNKHQDILEEAAFSAGVLQYIKSLPSVQATFDDARSTFTNFMLSTKPQPISFHETHESNQVYRHDPTGIFFGTILAKAAHSLQQKDDGNNEESEKIKGDLPKGLHMSTPIPLLAELLKNLDSSRKNPVDVGNLSAAILRYYDSILKADSRDPPMKNRKNLRSGVVNEPKGEL